MSTSTQTIFSRAVKHHLHDGFVSLLDRIDEFNLGAVFTYHGKPHFWRKKELDFTGALFTDLFAQSDAGEAGFTYNKESNVLFDETSDSSQRTIDIDLDLDGDVKFAVADIGGDFGGSGKKIVKISVSLGSFTHITTDMGNQLTSSGQKFTANLEHPVIREAVNKGKTLFVISSLFQSQKVEIKISREEDVSVSAKESAGTDDNKNQTDSSGATGGTSSSDPSTTTSKSEGVGEKVVDEIAHVGKEAVATGLGIPEMNEGLKGDTKAVTTGITVTDRERPSNIGFSVLRIDIGKDGSLTPQAQIGIPYDRKIHASYGDAFVNLSSQGTEKSKDKKEETDDGGRGLEPPKEHDKQDPPKAEDKQTSSDADKKDDDATGKDSKEEESGEDKKEKSPVKDEL